MIKKTLKYHILKSIYSIRGFLKSRKFKEGDTWYVGLNEYGVYRGKGIFYVTHQMMEPTTGVVWISTENKKYKYWQITALNFHKI